MKYAFSTCLSRHLISSNITLTFIDVVCVCGSLRNLINFFGVEIWRRISALNIIKIILNYLPFLFDFQITPLYFTNLPFIAKFQKI
uniref:Uncharacterized protein n=1 Tax=Heterorhabditis bacteriophora TaxID=37862 RepID=A0A1I7WFY0_HETBA